MPNGIVIWLADGRYVATTQLPIGEAVRRLDRHTYFVEIPVDDSPPVFVNPAQVISISPAHIDSPEDPTT